MSQADSQASLARLKQALSQLQGVMKTLEDNELNVPAAAVDALVVDTENLVQQLRGQTPVAPTETTPTASDDWDDDLFVTPTPVTPPAKSRQTSQPPASIAQPSIRQRKIQPWWQRQKLLIGAVATAIACIFIWKLTTATPQISPEIAQSEPSSTTEQVEPTPTPQVTEPEVMPDPVPTVVEPEVVVQAPPRPLTPEQRLIAAIQSQLDEVTQPYGDNIVRSVEADFAQSTLRITVGDAWYLLKEGLQDRLGTEVLKLAQILDFKNMRVEDLAGNFVARNPVVGDRLVIVRRYQDFTGES